MHMALFPWQERNDSTPDHHKYHTKSSNFFLAYQTEFNLSHIYQATILKYLISKNMVQELETWETMCFQ